MIVARCNACRLLWRTLEPSVPTLRNTHCECVLFLTVYLLALVALVAFSYALLKKIKIRYSPLQ